MRIAVLLCCIALTLADKTPSKRGIGAEAFAKPHSQDSSVAFNLQDIVSANQFPQHSFGDQYGYQSPFLGHPGGLGFGGGISHIPPQVAPQQKPAQLALAAAAAVAQQNFGDPAYGSPPPQRPTPLQALNNQPYSQLPQYRAYGQQLQNYVSQPIALNYGNTQVNTYPPPPPQQPVPLNYGNAQVSGYSPQPSPQPPISTFQAYGQGQRAQSYYAPARDLFNPAPPQVLPEAPQPSPIVYASPQPPLAAQYAAPQPVAVQYAAPSYGLQAAKAPGSAFSFSNFASGDQLTTSSGFRPIHP